MGVYVLTQSALGPSAVYQVLIKKQEFSGLAGLSLLVNFTGTTNPATGLPSGAAAVATATVQVSNDPLAISNTPNAARWNAHDILQGLTTDKNDSLGFTVLAIRLNLTSYTSGTVALQICASDVI